MAKGLMSKDGTSSTKSNKSSIFEKASNGIASNKMKATKLLSLKEKKNSRSNIKKTSGDALTKVSMSIIRMGRVLT